MPEQPEERIEATIDIGILMQELGRLAVENLTLRSQVAAFQRQMLGLEQQIAHLRQQIALLCADHMPAGGLEICYHTDKNCGGSDAIAEVAQRIDAEA